MNQALSVADSNRDTLTRDSDQRRPIRSFVRRTGRMTEAQHGAVARYAPQFMLDYAPRPLDLAQAFGRAAPCALEIGFGNGEQLLASAASEPERNWLGIEVHLPGVGFLLHRAGPAGLSNLRVIAHDAVEVLRDMLAPSVLDEVRILFPDPWPKARHHKRRLIQPEFLALLAARLRVGGRLHLATDWEPYAQTMVDALAATPGLSHRAAASGFVERPRWRVQSRFERRGVGLGHGVFDLCAERVA